MKDDAKTLERFKHQVLKLKGNACVADVLDLLSHQILRAKRNQPSQPYPVDNNGNKLHWG